MRYEIEYSNRGRWDWSDRLDTSLDVAKGLAMSALEQRLADYVVIRDRNGVVVARRPRALRAPGS